VRGEPNVPLDPPEWFHSLACIDSRFCLELPMVRVAFRRHSGLNGTKLLPPGIPGPHYFVPSNRVRYSHPTRAVRRGQSSRSSRWHSPEGPLRRGASGSGITHLLRGRPLPASVDVGLILQIAGRELTLNPSSGSPDAWRDYQRRRNKTMSQQIESQTHNGTATITSQMFSEMHDRYRGLLLNSMIAVARTARKPKISRRRRTPQRSRT